VSRRMEGRDGGAGLLADEEEEVAAWNAQREARLVERWVKPSAVAVFVGLFGGFATELMRQYHSTASPALGAARSFDTRNKERVRFMSRVMAQAALRGAGGMGAVVGGYHAARLGLEWVRGTADVANYAAAAAPVGCAIALATSTTRSHGALFRRGLAGAVAAGVLLAPVGYLGAMVDSVEEEDARTRFLAAFRERREAGRREEEERKRGESMVAETARALRARAERMASEDRTAGHAPPRRTWVQWLRGQHQP